MSKALFLSFCIFMIVIGVLATTDVSNQLHTQLCFATRAYEEGEQ